MVYHVCVICAVILGILFFFFVFIIIINSFRYAYVAFLVLLCFNEFSELF